MEEMMVEASRKAASNSTQASERTFSMATSRVAVDLATPFSNCATVVNPPANREEFSGNAESHRKALKSFQRLANREILRHSITSAALLRDAATAPGVF